MSFTSVFVHNTLSDGGRTPQVLRVPHSRILAVDDATGKKQSVPEARGATLLCSQGILALLASQQVQKPIVMPMNKFLVTTPVHHCKMVKCRSLSQETLLTGLGFRRFSGPIFCLLKRLHQLH